MNTSEKVADVLRYCGFKAKCIQKMYVTVKGVTEAERIEIETRISAISPNFKGIIFSI